MIDVYNQLITPECMFLHVYTLYVQAYSLQLNLEMGREGD